ncbi:MAG: ParB/RepB/Spo0J family partition protein [Marinibacterium sp.]|nr:ParB/RepB/Spo0J family partition protein [Marinibacterium sp.]
MAKRRERIKAPSAEDLNRMEAEFRRETPGLGVSAAVAPIAQVAAEAAAEAPVTTPQARVEAARLKTDAEALRAAEADGRLIVEIALDDIAVDNMIRDRSVLDEAELIELRKSIALSGLRLPIEVMDRGDDESPRYALISGYRRLQAFQGLLELTADARYARIRALVRAPVASADAFAAMVEENEIRSELSPFERGRIAALAAQQGAFVNVEAAVDALFVQASKAKRSKVRSFAMVYEELGDMLHFAESLSEKRGLRLAQALRGGLETPLREALAAGQDPQSVDDEWALMEPVLALSDAAPKSPSRGGRPRKAAGLGWDNADVLRTSAGITIRKQRDSKGFVLRLEGKLDDDLMASLMEEIRALLER